MDLGMAAELVGEAVGPGHRTPRYDRSPLWSHHRIPDDQQGQSRREREYHPLLFRYRTGLELVVGMVHSNAVRTQHCENKITREIPSNYITNPSRNKGDVDGDRFCVREKDFFVSVDWGPRVNTEAPRHLVVARDEIQ